MNNMYDVVKNVLTSKNYDLNDILGKINTVWIQGDITDAQKLELIALAQKNAQVENSIDIMSKLEEMDKRMKALEAIVFAPETEEPGEGEDSGETDEPATVLYPEFVPGKWYYNGDGVSFNGEPHECIAPEGVVCVWSPADYPAYWRVVTVEELPEEEPTEPEVPEEEPTEPEVPEEEESQELTE